MGYNREHGKQTGQSGSPGIQAKACECAQMTQADHHSGRQTRQPFHADIEFIADFDVVKAKSLDISDGGVCFEVSGPLPFEMRLEHQGMEDGCRAHLVWVKRLPNGTYRLGFEFQPNATQPGI